MDDYTRLSKSLSDEVVGTDLTSSSPGTLGLKLNLKPSSSDPGWSPSEVSGFALMAEALHSGLSKAYIYIYIYTHMHTYMHAYIHTCIQWYRYRRFFTVEDAGFCGQGLAKIPQCLC